MADTDYKENGATSIISMLGSIVAALGFEITDNAKAAVTMLKMQKAILEDATLKDFLTGAVTMKTIQNISSGIWYVPGKLVHFVQSFLASEIGGGYPSGGGIEFREGADLTKIPVRELPKQVVVNAEDSKYTPWEIFSEFVKKEFNITTRWTGDLNVWKNDEDVGLYYVPDGEDSWIFKKNLVFLLRYFDADKKPGAITSREQYLEISILTHVGDTTYRGTISEGESTVSGVHYEYRNVQYGMTTYLRMNYIYYPSGTIDDNSAYHKVPSNQDVADDSFTTNVGISYDTNYNGTHLTKKAYMYLSTDAYLVPPSTGGGITRGGGVGRDHHSLPQDENFPPCGGDTTVEAITEWSGRVINWNGECYMPLTYFKVNSWQDNPGVTDDKPIEPDDPRVDPDSPEYEPDLVVKIIDYTYPNDYVQTAPQDGDNTVQSSGQLKNNYTNSNNGPSDIPSTEIKSGLYTLWHPSADNLQNLGAFLYGGTAQGTIASIIGDPINAIIQLTEWAVTPVDGPSKSPVICNIAATELKMPTIPNQFMQFDCGTIEIPREYSDFRDYEPYTRLSLFLPFVGDVNISTNDCITPHKIHVIYNIDFLSGVACAEVLVDDDVRYAYQAAMCAAIPVTSSDASRLLASLIGAAVGTIGGGIMGSIVGGTTGSRIAARSRIGGVSDAALSPINGIQTQRTGSISANTGLLGEMKPYVLVTRPISVVADQYKSLLGQPYQLDGTLGSQKGFVKVREVHLDGITATESEKEEIERLLKEGVIL